jgi:hypothetical protein
VNKVELAIQAMKALLAVVPEGCEEHNYLSDWLDEMKYWSDPEAPEEE